MMEEWREIPDTGGLYEASSLGRIRSKDRVTEIASRWGGTRPMPCLGRVLKPWTDANGYEVVYICFDGQRIATNVHRLVARAFLTASKGREHVNHIDADKRNNAPCNLEWVTRSENMLHARDHGLIKSKPLVAEPVSGGTVLNFPSINHAARALGKGHTSIQRALSGRYSQAYGYRWKYAEPAEMAA